MYQMADGISFNVSIDPQTGKLQAFLTKLSQHLTKDNVEQLCFLLNLPACTREKTKTGIQLFGVLQEGKLISPQDVSVLSQMFEIIMRRDLKLKVDSYQKDVKKHQPISTHLSRPSQISATSPEKSVEFPGGAKPRSTPPPLLRPPSEFSSQSKGKGTVNEEPSTPRGKTQKSTTRDIPKRAAEQAESSESGSFTGTEETLQGTAVSYALEQVSLRQLPGPVTGLVNDKFQIDPFGETPITAVDEYKMRSETAGLCVIINNFDFSKSRENSEVPTFADRSGAKKDKQQLKDTFTWLGYKVELRDDLEALQMRDYLKEVASRDHSKYDSFCCCLLSYGMSTGIYGVDGKTISYPKLFELFYPKDCETLENKPKIFFLQACLTDIDSDKSSEGMLQSAKGPDYFIGYPTTPGNRSWRHDEYGSIYVNALCLALQGLAHEKPLTAICIAANNRVAERLAKESYTQIPLPLYSIMKEIRFKPISKTFSTLEE